MAAVVTSMTTEIDQQILEEIMEKIGVVIDKEKEREAEKTGKCPLCGAVLINFNPPQCRNCGTEPFEPGTGTMSGRSNMKNPAEANPPRSDDFDLGGES